ncbi:MAG TPA: serine/threonine-protein kinase [Planctomycetota bacterium]|nr:serine/threonine-protein kinase [Planctomycetota bacterium]
MTSGPDVARWQRVRALLHAAADLPEPQRSAFLRAESGGDESVVAEVLRLLAADRVGTGEVLPPDVPGAGAAPDVGPGLRLGRYRLSFEIGRGGMGVVHEAEEEGTGRLVAVKVVRPHLAALPSVRERFLREARVGLSLKHENVVRTIDVGETTVAGRPVPWLVMERVLGRTLREVLATSGAVDEPLVREIGRQAARGLAAVHEAGAVHRDVKPENLVLLSGPRVLLMDLGVAKVDAAGPALTTAGQFVGSIRYAAPEQRAGLDIGPPADLWALGAVLAELVTGEPPDASGSTPTLSGRASAFLVAVVRQLVAPRPQDRFASARHLSLVLADGEDGTWWSLHKGR